MNSVFITGASSGLGRGFVEIYLNQGFKVYACSRSEIDIVHDNLFFTKIDFSDINSIYAKLSDLNIQDIKIAILNAGMVDDVKTTHNSSLEDIYNIMNINAFSNKIILDFFINNKIPINQVIAISSLASKYGYKGLGSYSLSKSTLNMLIQLYAKEMLNTHFISISPGVIKTKIVKKILGEANENEFEFIKSLRNSDKFSVKQAVLNITSNTDALLKYNSGYFLEIKEYLL